jgi:[ribosomal protein S5]-alanine N-acetyltransferase
MIETTRLIIRPYLLNDAGAVFSMFNDKDVMEFIPTGIDRTLDETQNRIVKYIDHFDTFGYSKYVLIDKNSGLFIGDCGIYRFENSEINELGYRIKKQFWNQGYASEAARAVIEHAFKNLKFSEIHAIVEKQNIKSIYVLEKKLGFKHCGQLHCYGEDFELYKFTNETASA